MKAVLLPLILLLVGTGAGVGAGLYLTPPAEEPVDEAGEAVSEEAAPAAAEPVLAAEPEGPREYARMSNQFVIPIVEDGQIVAMVVLSLNLEVKPGTTEAIFAAEPKLRDRFLQVMFDFANVGGFSGNFTTGTNMRTLRLELLRVAREITSGDVTDVLVMEIVRQDS